MRNKIYNKVAAESKAIAFTIHLLLFTLITSCSQEAVIALQDTPDALAMMNPDTPVGISAQVESVKDQAMTRAIWVELPDYAWNELHEQSNLDFVKMLVSGGSSDNIINNVKLQYNNNLSGLNEAYGLFLKDFNLMEGNGRKVSRWAIMEEVRSYSAGDYDVLRGVARLTANVSTGQPELKFTLRHPGSKLTVKLVDTDGKDIPIEDISVKAIVQENNSVSLIYTGATTPSGYYMHIKAYLDGITSLREDESVDANKIVWALTKSTKMADVTLKPLVYADGTPVSGNDNVVSAIVPATATHTNAKEEGDNFSYYAPLENSGLTDADVLTITVNTDPDGDGPQTTGTYKLKLSDVKLSETENLTALKSGEHYILTVTLKHNTLVSATATVAGWNEVSADVTLQGNDPSFIPPYEYDANTNTYTIWQEEGIEACLQDKEANNRTDATVMYEGMTIDATLAELAIVSGAETDLNAVKAAIDGKTVVIVTGTELAEHNGTVKTVMGEAIHSLATNEDSPKVGTITLLMPKVETLPQCAFVICYALKSVSASATTTIGNYAFQSCSLSSASFLAVESIGEYAFWQCTKLATLSFASVINSIVNRSFEEVGTDVGGCALTLASGQEYFTAGTPNGTAVVAAAEDADKAARTWAGNTWKSVTIK